MLMNQIHLGAVAPSTQTSFNETIAGLEELHIQAFLDLSILADQGRDVAAYKVELDALGEQISLLRAETVTMSDDERSISAWRTRANALDAKLLDILARTGRDRQSAPELAQLKGLGWALGVLMAATAVGAYVWRNRAKTRRRRR